MCVRLGERRRSRNAWASFCVILCLWQYQQEHPSIMHFWFIFLFLQCLTYLKVTHRFLFSLATCTVYKPLLNTSCDFFLHHILCAPAMFLCEPGSLIENIITFWLFPTVTTAILQCWVSSNVSRAGMEEILHFLFLILSEKLNWDIGSPVEEIKMCVTSLFYLWKRFGEN